MIFFQAFDFQAMANEKTTATTTTSMQLVSAPTTTTVDVVVSAEPHIERQSASQSQLPQASKAQQQVATSVVSGIRDKSKFFKLKINI